MKRAKKIMMFSVLLLPLIIVFSFAVVVLETPLRRPASFIREDMLKLTPIGSSMDDVIEVIENNGKWEIKYIDYDFGFLKQETHEPRIIVGEKSIRVFQGEYKSLILKTYVNVFYGFDENSKLIDVWVWKDTPLL